MAQVDDEAVRRVDAAIAALLGSLTELEQELANTVRELQSLEVLRAELLEGRDETRH
jgi:uncharacterized protein YbcI